MAEQPSETLTPSQMETSIAISAAKPKKRHKRKNSTPKTTRKTVAANQLMETSDNNDETSNTVTVHIPESQLVHLGTSGEPSLPDTSAPKGMRKQEATSVFVPIYLTNSKKTFKCSKCPAEFRSKEERGDHGSLHKKHFKCNDCSKRYYTVEALESHRANETHIHTCDRCSKVFHSQVYLKRHKAVHVEERNFACDICHKTYTSLANCRAHKRSVHAVVKKHVCDECGKAFARKDKLKRHQLIHIPYPNRPVFPCPFRSHTGCTSTFYREDKLKRHLFTHSKEKPYKCDQCDKGFARRDNLNDHMKTHTKDFSYVCTLCQRGFLGPAKLKKHLKAVHPDEEYDFETLAQRAREAPTMASLKTTIPQEESALHPEKALETQVNVGLDVVNQAICCQSSHYQHSNEETVDSDEDEDEDDSPRNKEVDVTMVSQEGPLMTISQSLPPAPPLIHQACAVVSSNQVPIISAGVFIPRMGLQPGTPFSRDMVTIPNELLSMVHGLNS
ncbi:hypothetical protein QZH41_009258 [Actinostola sp. cb2023]|nr:hypothetical protein QZH41_009258 [Actinostola sp. cb2023]